MASEGERCVDELLVITRKVDELCQKLSLDKTDLLLDDSRKLLETTQSFIDHNRPLIPPYIFKKVTESLKRLERQVDIVDNSKMSFKFSSLTQSGVVNENESKPISSQHIESVGPAESDSDQAFFGFRGKTDEQLCMGPDEVGSKDVSLVDLVDCSVKIIGLANTLYIRNLKGTTVTVCLACRAITIANCTDCTFKFICQQLRIDSTTDCSFSIFTSARSMLESSKNLTFKMLKLDELAGDVKIESDQLVDYVRRANFNENQNNWKCIDDFDWLSPTMASINYKICE